MAEQTEVPMTLLPDQNSSYSSENVNPNQNKNIPQNTNVNVNSYLNQVPTEESPSCNCSLQSFSPQNYLTRYSLFFTLQYLIIGIATFIIINYEIELPITKETTEICGGIYAVVAILNIIPCQLYNLFPLNILVWLLITGVKTEIVLFFYGEYKITIMMFLIDVIVTFSVFFILSIFCKIHVCFQIIISAGITFLALSIYFSKNGDQPETVTQVYADGFLFGFCWITIVAICGHLLSKGGEFQEYSFFKVNYSAILIAVLIPLLILSLFFKVCSCLTSRKPDAFDEDGKKYYHKYGDIYEDEYGHEVRKAPEPQCVIY